MREKHNFNLRRRIEELTPEKLAAILRNTTTEEDAARTYKNLTGMEIPVKKEHPND